MSKVYADHAFPGLIGPVWLEDVLAEHSLGLFARFIGYAQVSIGFLLLTLRFSSLGAVMSIPLISNILMVTISMNWKGTPYVLAVLLLMNFFVLWIDRKRFYPLIGLASEATFDRFTMKGVVLWTTGFAFVLTSPLVSLYFLALAYSMVGLGLLLAIISWKMDKKG